ncbi:MAG: DUF401 family protein [Deltaproteobacteria bacterium]|nr:DUF401 family protein [Deltaproteobacteria bacterium]
MLVAFAPFAKVLAAFAVMLAGVRLRLSLGLSILCGAMTLGLLFGIGPRGIVQASALALTDEKFLLLALIVGLILMLSDALERSGQSRRLMAALSGYLTRPRLRLVFFPALIGLLPMPGGAIFSAPMIKTASEGMAVSSAQQALINYWFRHIWELAWPLYPGIILTVALADIPISAFVSRTWPAVLFMVGIGWFFFLRPGKLDVSTPKTDPNRPRPRPGAVFYEGLPLLVAIIGAVGLESLIPILAPTLAFEIGVIAALFVAVICVMIQNGLGPTFLGAVLAKKSLWSMLLVIAAIFVFKDVLSAAGVVEAMARSAGGNAALIASAVFLPFLVGMVAGINVAFVGSTFPLLLGLIHTLGLEDKTIPFLILASFAGFTGVMISPIHICFILTCQFFRAEAARTWRQLVAPCLTFALLGGLFFLVLIR